MFKFTDFTVSERCITLFGGKPSIDLATGTFVPAPRKQIWADEPGYAEILLALQAAEKPARKSRANSAAK